MDKRQINSSRETRKTVRMHRVVLPQPDVDRLYIPRNNCRKGIISAEDCRNRKQQ